ncbi:serine--tRNA ligase, mitochondrial-like [Myxocyprinus asiaticus]|uniref:serine--tRNA ligase, mitochondrial-like n=1 Tax=Myxocyprinus asiaticus TaxID=70543 RepID=UPI0022214D17|nr:serine--tRNA ligase, mitochondrial-like [Myxocyprinus asiaticus]
MLAVNLDCPLDLAPLGIRSSLYEHIWEGYSHKPELDMQHVCKNMDEVVAEVENRKGDLRPADVRRINLISNLKAIWKLKRVLTSQDKDGLPMWALIILLEWGRGQTSVGLAKFCNGSSSEKGIYSHGCP